WIWLVAIDAAANSIEKRAIVDIGLVLRNSVGPKRAWCAHEPTDCSTQQGKPRQPKQSRSCEYPVFQAGLFLRAAILGVTAFAGFAKSGHGCLETLLISRRR